MAAKDDVNGGETPATAVSLSRIANLIAAMLCAGKAQSEQVQLLQMAGFSTGEIARLLNTTAHTVSQTLYAAKKKKPRRAGRNK